MGIGKWRVVYETRKRGSIGAFEHSTREVDGASNSDDATRKAFDMLQSEGLETRSPVSVRRIDTQGAQ